MAEKIEGCTHLIIKDGKITKVVTHLERLPENGVIHLKSDKVYSIEEFKESHPRDHAELEDSDEKIEIGGF